MKPDKKIKRVSRKSFPKRAEMVKEDFAKLQKDYKILFVPTILFPGKRIPLLGKIAVFFFKRAKGAMDLQLIDTKGR